MYKTVVVFLCAFVFLTELVMAQEKEDTFEVIYTIDSNFGNYPNISGTFPLSEKFDAYVYGFFYTNQFFFNENGNGPWVEAGLGLQYTANDNFSVIPTLGISNGSLLSAAATPLLADGLVPGFLLFYDRWGLSYSLFASHYTAIIRDNPASIDFLFWGTSLAKSINKTWSAGIMLEQVEIFELAPKTNYTEYLWLGPTITANFKEKYSITYSFGVDYGEIGYNQFYRLSASIPF